MHALSLSFPITPLCGPGHAVYPPGLVSDKFRSSDSPAVFTDMCPVQDWPLQRTCLWGLGARNTGWTSTSGAPGLEHHYRQVDPTQRPKTHPEPGEPKSGRDGGTRPPPSHPEPPWMPLQGSGFKELSWGT